MRGRVSIPALMALAALFLAIAAMPASAKKKPPAHPVNLNTATLTQLEQLPGIGPVTAKRIVEFREKSGPFRRAEDLLAIPGISKKRLQKLRPYVAVSPPPRKKSSR